MRFLWDSIASAIDREDIRKWGFDQRLGVFLFLQFAVSIELLITFGLLPNKSYTRLFSKFRLGVDRSIRNFSEEVIDED